MLQGRWKLVRSAFIFSAVISTQAFSADYPAVPGEYVVKLKSTIATFSQKSLASTLGVEVVKPLSADSGAVLVRRPVGELSTFAVSQLANNPLVEYAEPNYIYTVVGGADALPNDPQLGRLWGLINTGQMTTGDGGNIQGVAGIDIDAQRAWQIETGSHDVKIAVIDTGLGYNNPDLVDNVWTNETELNGTAGVDDDNNGCVDDIHGCDFVNNDGDPMDDHGHGSHCSGTIAGKSNNGIDVAGIAWNAQIVGAKFLSASGGGTLANAVLAIDYARNVGVNIMSNSWGGGGFSQALLESIQRARDAGILFIAAAGNNATNMDVTPGYPASYEVDNVISVAAVDAGGQLASFSNYGATKVHLAAPGVNILSTTPRGLQSWSGTSMACPHVSGVAALLISQRPDQTYAEIKTRLLNGARPLASISGKTQTGLLNAYYSLTDTSPPADPNDPSSWEQVPQAISTPHPYSDNYTNQWTITVPGAKRVAVHFSSFATESGYDWVTFKDKNGASVGRISGGRGVGFGPVVEGDTVTVVFSTDNSVPDQGFDIDAVAFEPEDEAPQQLVGN